MKINNKDIIQSYIMTTAKYDFSVYEKRIIYRIVETLQFLTEGKKLNQYYRLDKELFGDHRLTMPISDILKDEDDKNHALVKKALLDLENKRFEYEDESEWEVIRIIENPKIKKYETTINFRINQKVFNAFLNFSKGFRKYELKTAMSFDSIYAMRFYELFSGQKSPIIYSISNLKIMFKIEDKYNKINDFFKRVIDPSKKELDEKSPYSFEYKSIKEGRKITAIKFYPVFISKNRDEDIEKSALQKQVSPAWYLDKISINYLKENFLFTIDEIKNNIDILKEADQKLDLLLELSKLKRKALNAKNPKGYIINSLKKMLLNIL